MLNSIPMALKLLTGFSFSSELFVLAGASERKNMSTRAYNTPIKPKSLNVLCQEYELAKVAPNPPNA
ncbi:hypothetical protein D3C86_1452210 [compost metagenome]